MKKKAVALLLTAIMIMANTIVWMPKTIAAQEVYSEAEKSGKENSFRYQDGQRIPSKMRKGSVVPSKVTMIDVSHHQGTIDWEKVKEAGVEAVIIRCGYGQDQDENGEYTQDDAYFKQNVSECERLGIPYGIYIYSYAKKMASARSEADHVARLIKEAKAAEGVLSFFTYPVFYDIEDKSLEGVSASQLQANGSAFVSQMKSYGYDNLGFYSNKDWFSKRLTGSIFSLYPKWIAQYGSECTYTKSYRLWQYTNQASVDGIYGLVDANVKNGNWEAGQSVQSVTLNKKTSLITDSYSTTVKASVNPTTVINPYVQWKSSNSSVASVNSSGKITGEKPGKATITATAHNGKKASVAVTIKPRKNKITSLKRSGSKSIKVTWSKVSGVTGYRIYMSTKKSSGYKRIRIASSSSSTYTKSGLRKGKKYYFKVRSYKKVGDSYIYSSYSDIKYITR